LGVGLLGLRAVAVWLLMMNAPIAPSSSLLIVRLGGAAIKISKEEGSNRLVPSSTCFCVFFYCLFFSVEI